MKTLLIFGGSGLVGSTLIQKLSGNYNVVATHRNNAVLSTNTKNVKLDLLDTNINVNPLLEKELPDIVVNTIAFSNVDYCETNKKDADYLHVTRTEEIAKACDNIGAKLIYISTDWVFDDSKKIFSENDIPNPMNYYGITRLRAEKSVLNQNQRNVVIRPAVIYGWHKNAKFLNFVLENLKSKKEVFAFTDQYSTPTLVYDLVDSIRKIIELDAEGIFHTVGSSCVNRFEFAKKIAQKFDYDENLIKPVITDEKPQVAKRPKISCLDNSKARKELGVEFSTIDKGIEIVLKLSTI